MENQETLFNPTDSFLTDLGQQSKVTFPSDYLQLSDLQFDQSGSFSDPIEAGIGDSNLEITQFEQAFDEIFGSFPPIEASTSTPESPTVSDDFDPLIGDVSTLLAEVVWDSTVSTVKEQLETFAAYEEFHDKMKLAFGDDLSSDVASALIQDLASGEAIPEIKIVPDAELNNANGAFGEGTIYLSEEFLTENVTNPEAVEGVLLEEIGHYIDKQLRSGDSRGDEGNIFAELVQDNTISGAELGDLKAEDDSTTIGFEGEKIDLELATPDSNFAETIATIAEEEWEFFDQGSLEETEEGAWQRVVEYWETPGLDNPLEVDKPEEVGDPDNPWSAAFISWVMNEGGAGDKFEYSASHSEYITDAIKDRKEKNSEALFFGYKLDEYSPKVGDLVGYPRQAGVDFDTPAPYKSHTDIVVDVRDGEIDVIGGNVGQSVTKKTLQTDSEGRLTDESEDWFVVLGNQLTGNDGNKDYNVYLKRLHAINISDDGQGEDGIDEVLLRVNGKKVDVPFAEDGIKAGEIKDIEQNIELGNTAKIELFEKDRGQGYELIGEVNAGKKGENRLVTLKGNDAEYRLRFDFAEGNVYLKRLHAIDISDDGQGEDGIDEVLLRVNGKKVDVPFAEDGIKAGEIKDIEQNIELGNTAKIELFEKDRGQGYELIGEVNAGKKGENRLVTLKGNDAEYRLRFDFVKDDQSSNGDGSDSSNNEVLWGVDSVDTITQSFLDDINRTFGAPDFFGRYLGGDYALTDNEVTLAQENDIKLLIVDQSYGPTSTDLVSYGYGQEAAEDAVNNAQALGIPSDVGIFANIEASSVVDSGWLNGWFDMIAEADYVPGYYANPLDKNRDDDFESAYAEAIGTNSQLGSEAIIWTNQDSVGRTTKEEAPEWNPTGLESNPDAPVLAWQYGIPSDPDDNFLEGPNVDTDLALSTLPFWG